jgi:hypothetical protein
MASMTQVKQYLAYWFQLGKKLILSKSNRTILPSQVYQGDRYSAEFESCWTEIITHPEENAYLEGTYQTISELLSSKWDILPCARCNMPVPMINLGFVSPNCPCSDMDSWPNQELPSPRAPINTHQYLDKLTRRLEAKD